MGRIVLPKASAGQERPYTLIITDAFIAFHKFAQII